MVLKTGALALAASNPARIKSGAWGKTVGLPIDARPAHQQRFPEGCFGSAVYRTDTPCARPSSTSSTNSAYRQSGDEWVYATA